ncbi:hypothetical protein GALL_71760 [mine drainage metagenome]|uniref:DUF1566 domain-containing protein n=1 Tax=mine drainage metagenome TaxID=410659 RepID=A0A1J5T418_9ZZZZ
MSETTTLKVGGAEVTVETSALFRAWLEKHLGQHIQPSFAIQAARPGERYAGSIIEPSGRMRHTFLLPGDEKVPDWNAGMAWAKDCGGDLPDRVEQAMLNAYLSDEFKPEAYWSNTQHAGYSYNAWYQHFDDGYHYYYYRKSAELRVRAVRRVFSDSVI